MKKFTLILSLLLATVFLQAQDYQISFAGTGASTNVGTVIVENLTQGKSISLLGSEVLHLVATGTGITPMFDNENALRIYPNPTTNNSKIDFVATASGKVNIELFDIAGRRICTTQNTLTIGNHSYQVSGLRSGIYTVRILSPAYTYTSKLISNGATNSDLKISYLGNVAITASTKMLKRASTEATMQYTAGDRLKITGTSNIYSTVVVDVPTESKTITFPFVTCQDADLNNYSVVTIGTQTWMVQNLKTTKFRTGEDIGTTTPASLDISAESTPNYQWAYNGDENMAAKYGRLYTWYAIVDSRNIAPIGWHVSTDAEWSTLANYVNANLGTSGSVAKSLAATTDWATDDYPVGTIGKDLTKNNTSGFTALPGGYRYYNGSFDLIGIYGYWWSSTEDFATYVWNRILNCGDGSLGRYDSMKSEGLSVRCVRDDNTACLVVPTLNTTTASSITTTTATSGGNISDDGCASITAIGVCWSTNQNPTILDSKTTDGTSSGIFTSYITGLTAGTTYYMRAYATNSAGSGYGSEVNFTTTDSYSYTVTLSSNPLLGGITTGGGIYNSGTSVTVSATPTAGFIFSNWTERGTVVSTTASYTFTISYNRTLTANFNIW